MIEILSLRRRYRYTHDVANVEREQPQGPTVRRPTELMREIITTSDEFTLHLGRELTVNPTDLSAMTHLISAGPMVPTELARRLGLSAAAVTTVIDRLEGLGHATRERHPTDRRSVVVVPSPASVGRAMATLMPMITGIDGVLDGFDEMETAAITAYLERVVAVYRAQLPT